MSGQRDVGLVAMLYGGEGEGTGPWSQGQLLRFCTASGNGKGHLINPAQFFHFKFEELKPWKTPLACPKLQSEVKSSWN